MRLRSSIRRAAPRPLPTGSPAAQRRVPRVAFDESLPARIPGQCVSARREGVPVDMRVRADVLGLQCSVRGGVR
jgi:hypothetical protein